MRIDVETKTEFVGWTTVAVGFPAPFVGNTYFQTPNAKLRIDSSGYLAISGASNGTFIDTMISYPMS